MLQVLQNIRSGALTIGEAPDPRPKPGQVLVANRASVISAGTERHLMELASKSLAGKAKERPDHLRRVVEKARQEGLLNTTRQVFRKLDEPMSMGYASSGIVLACGDDVQGLSPGDRVASNGPHADIVSVPRNLCALVSDNVPHEQAAFTVLGATALQGIRLSELQLGETAFVVGLGVIGQLATALLRASGCRVLATDPLKERCELALAMGAEVAWPGLPAEDVATLTRGLGADGVLVTASTTSKEPMDLAAKAVRAKGRIVLVGLVGLELDRRPFYEKEVEFVVSRAYGPGRYDPGYEDRGHDYPAPYVRWTVQRNMQAVLDFMATGPLDVEPLISHRFAFDQALQAYELIADGDRASMGVVLEYPESRPAAQPRVELNSPNLKGGVGIGCIGAGHFARNVLLPAIRKQKALRRVGLCSTGGAHAAQAGEKHGFEYACSDERELLQDDKVQAVFIATQHNDHACQVVGALNAGKHVFVEKPLALTEDELYAVETALEAAQPGPPMLMVGFNRRFSPAARLVREFVSRVEAPLTVSVRFNAGAIPASHWTQDHAVGGGRIIGEACHGIDLATYLTGSLPVRVFAEAVGGPDAPDITDDQCVIHLRHANGSLSTVLYTAGGDKAFPKERVEVFGGGRVAVLEDFKDVTTVFKGKTQRHRARSQDKGHGAEVAAFAVALTGRSEPPISWRELKAVSLASILAVESIRQGVPLDVP